MKKFIRGILVICAALAAAEGVSYLLLPEAKLGRLEYILQVLEEDPVLFWKVSPRQDRFFQGVRIRTNSLGLRSREIAPKRAGELRVVCLGESPTFGWGVEEEQSYPRLLERKLAAGFPGRKVEVINAAQIGYTSYQGLILLKDAVLKLSPDIITVPYVLNDIDRYRFFRNEAAGDKELSPAAPAAVALRNTLAKSRFLALARRSFASLLFGNDRFASQMFKKQFNLSKTRVSLDDYRSNLREFIRICSARKIKLIFIKMPVHLSLPVLSAEDEAFLGSGGTLSMKYYQAACESEKAGDFARSRALFVKAKDYQVFELDAQSRLYHKAMDDVSRENGLPLLDAVGIFARAGRDRELYNIPHDPIHPNARGHGLIADGLFGAIVNNGLAG